MKIFANGDGWDEKVNFVDDNNVLVGYDMGQSCCENADWYISDKEEADRRSNELTDGLESYNFDKDYFQEVESKDSFEEGGMIRFRLVADGNPDLFLHIFNSHNGYYAHGFDAKINGLDWKSGSL